MGEIRVISSFLSLSLRFFFSFLAPKWRESRWYCCLRVVCVWHSTARESTSDGNEEKALDFSAAENRAISFYDSIKIAFEFLPVAPLALISILIRDDSEQQRVFLLFISLIGCRSSCL